jgi:hypothetical protein
MILLRLHVRQVSRVSLGVLLVLMFVHASGAQQPGTAMVFYGQPGVSEALWPDLFQSLRADLAAGESPDGFGLDRNLTLLRGNDELAKGIDFSRVVEVRLVGRCDGFRGSIRTSLTGPLGWVQQVSGGIQPFIFVDCTRIAEVLCSDSCPGLDQQGRRHRLAQAIAHVVIHEWIHIARQSSAHSQAGISKQFLSSRELTAEPVTHNLTIAHQ